MITEFKLTTSQQQGLTLLLNAKKNVFVTGAPGSGKSFLLCQYHDEVAIKPDIVASTGAAAILVGGRTFHSYFGLGIMEGGPAKTLERALDNPWLASRIESADTVIIDEVSMLPSAALDCAESISRAIRKDESPWGGIRVVTVGDFAQLPPISQNGQKDWCFLGEAWKKSNFEHILLNEIMRTHDLEFLKVLNLLRWGIVSTEVEDFLNDRITPDPKVDRDSPRLFPLRAQTEAYNQERLAEIPHPVRVYPTVYSGRQRLQARLMKDAPIPPILELKKNARVMIRVNDLYQRYVNGTIGTIVDMEDDRLWVDVDGNEFEFHRHEFKILDGDGHKIASAINFPINLAYASTIHKVQGATMERAHMDLRGLWEPGHAYVALSRVKKGDGITLTGWDRSSIKADPVVQAFYDPAMVDSHVYHTYYARS